jgi:hypothetical protein
VPVKTVFGERKFGQYAIALKLDCQGVRSLDLLGNGLLCGNIILDFVKEEADKTGRNENSIMLEVSVKVLLGLIL